MRLRDHARKITHAWITGCGWGHLTVYVLCFAVSIALSRYAAGVASVNRIALYMYMSRDVV